MQPILTIFVLAVLVEGLVEYFFVQIRGVYKRYVAAALGILVCVVYNADLLAMLGLPAALPYAGAVLTGLIISRGSNYLNDWITRAQTIPAPISTTTVISPVVQDRPQTVETPERGL